MSGVVIRNLSEQLVELVRDLILTGKVAPNLAIRQDALAAELGVSKIPLREALGRLEQEGLLRSQANRGYFVRALSAEEAEEVYALRLHLEPETAASAATLATGADQAAARQAFLAIRDIEHVTDRYGVGPSHRSFHLALLRPAGRPITVTMLERLHILSERYVRKHLEPVGRDERANVEHNRMIQAWLDRDAAQVGTLMRVHLEQTRNDLRKQLLSEE